jgi:YD repeat-containing protein
MTAKYVNGDDIDEVISLTKGSGTYYYHYDGLGSVTSLTDATGATVESYAYDVFGKPSTVSTLGNRYAFTGRE